MKITVDINDELVKEAWAILQPKTMQELIERSLEDLVHYEKLKRLHS